MQMKNRINKTVATAILILLIVSSAFLVFSSTSATKIPAQISSIPSNMLQYEWRQPKGSDPAATCFSDGPGPNAPNIKWKTQIPYLSGWYIPVAFNGMVFVQDSFGKTYALDGGTGDIVWSTELYGTMGKIDDTYMVIGNTCVKIADGSTVWTGPPGFVLYQDKMIGVGYIPELKMVADINYGWNLSDPSKPPTLAWNRTSENIYGEAWGLQAYGDGKLFYGGGDFFLVCFDARTGKNLWATPTTSAMQYGGTYVDGKFIFGGLDNNMYAWNATTGQLLWTYNPGTWYGLWASASGAAYGMVYEHNQDTYLYAINATTGKLVWRAKGPGIGYSNVLCIADGKVYCQMGENQYRDFETGEYAYSEYDCYDAYTGKLLWTLPMEVGAPEDLECIAYGNLYVTPDMPSPQEPGSWTYTLGGAVSLGEVWCISSEVVDWPMYDADPEHSAEGAGPTNLALKWKFQADAGIVSSPTLVDGVCYFGSVNGTIYAINANTGSQLWTFKTDHWVKSTVAVVDGKVYTGADDGNIYCLNAATGAKLWETYAGGFMINPLTAITYPTWVGADNSRSSPIVVGGRVYVGALDGNLYCLNANTGTVIWKFQTGGSIQATPTILNNEIYIPSSTPIPNGTFYKLNATSGSVIWQKEFPYVLNQSFGYGMWLLASATVVPDLGMVILRNGLRLNYALNATTGETIWTYDGKWNRGSTDQMGGVTQYMPMLYKYGRLYFNDYYGITCLNALNGSEIWYTWLSRENLAQGLTYSYQRIYTVNEMGVLYVLDALSGKKLYYYQFAPPSQMRCMPIPYNGSLYVGTNDWTLYCFGEARTMSTAASQASSLSASSVPSTTSTSTTIAVAVIGVAAIAVATILLKKRK